jgi:hypothetical protein
MISLTGITGLVCFGDSYVVGAPYASYALPGYVYQFAAQRGLSVENYSEGGSPLWAHVKAAHANLAPQRQAMAILAGSFHDMRRGGDRAKTCIKVEHLYRAWLANALLKDIQPASAGTITGFVRAWPDSVLQALGFRSVPAGGYTLAGGLGCTATYSVNGSRIVIGYCIADGVTQMVGRFRVSIDGVVAAIIDPANKTDGLGYYPGGYDQARIPAAAVFPVAAGTHTVLIEALDSQSAGPWSIIDYVGTLVEPADAAPIILLTPPRMTPAGYALQSPQWSNGNDSLIEFQGRILRAVAAEFAGYPVAVVETNDFFSLATDVFEDSAHPNMSGETHLKDALNSCIG